MSTMNYSYYNMNGPRKSLIHLTLFNIEINVV